MQRRPDEWDYPLPFLILVAILCLPFVVYMWAKGLMMRKDSHNAKETPR